jgi:5'-deoxynucleotidase YfbR-like HD superfamily hydrolase
VVETVTGDLLYPAKNHSPAVADMWQKIEDTIIHDYYPFMIAFLEEEARENFSDPLFWKAFRCADAIDGLLFCIEEREKGNTNKILESAYRVYCRNVKSFIVDFPFIKELLAPQLGY